MPKGQIDLFDGHKRRGRHEDGGKGRNRTVGGRPGQIIGRAVTRKRGGREEHYSWVTLSSIAWGWLTQASVAGAWQRGKRGAGRGIGKRLLVLVVMLSSNDDSTVLLLKEGMVSVMTDHAVTRYVVGPHRAEKRSRGWPNVVQQEELEK